jgi:hypothetical protein
MMRRLFSGIGSFLQNPIGVIFTTNVVWQIVMRVMQIPTYGIVYYVVSGVILLLDFIVAFLLRDKLIYFFSQFVLPIQNPKYRQEIYARVRDFETGYRGPALFVKNGRVIRHEGEADKRGAGLIVLDTASALVLRTDTEIRDTVGPGIKFTKGNEYIVKSVDLRTQQLFIGPLVTDPPLSNPVPISDPKEYNEIQNRRQQTSGLTRDGFEIAPTISIKFSIKRPASRESSVTESGVTSYYGYDENAVRNAITREMVQLGESKKSKALMEWNKLPEHLVINIWREYVRKFMFNDLFTSKGTSGLQTIEKMINKRVKQSRVEVLDDTGAQTDEWTESLEFKQLQFRGLEITEVRIHNVLFDKLMEEQMIDHWSTEWMNIAQKEAAYLKEKEVLNETAAREDANKTFARITSQQFGGKVTQPQQNPFKTLQLLISPLRDFILNESAANSEMEAELRKLDEIWKWLLDNNPPPPPPGNGGKP